MKKFLTVLFSLILFLIGTEVFGQSSIIKVKVKGIEDHIGSISIGLYNDSTDFPKGGVDGVRIAADCDSVVHIFTNLINGNYALAVYHDENNNKKLDRSFLGMPTESYMFSNYASRMFGPPSFDEAKFSLVDSVEIILDFRK